MRDVSNKQKSVTREHQHHPSPLRFWITLVIFSFFALVLLWEEHEAHILGALPWLILIACPLMHVFMHHDHNASKGNDDDGT